MRANTHKTERIDIMERTKSPTKKSKTKPGPKSGATPEVCEQAHRLCLLGLTNRELAVAFDVDESTISYWYKTQPRFTQAVQQGRIHADSRVAEALYLRALGYEHESVKFFKSRIVNKEFDEEGNVIREQSYDKIIKQPFTKKYPPDTKAAIKWLNNRYREQWNEMVRVKHEHKHMLKGDIEVSHIMEQLGDASTFTDEELEVAAKLGLSKATKQLTAPNN